MPEGALLSLLIDHPIIHHPLILKLGPVSLSGFGLAVALGFMMGQVVGQQELARRGHDPAPVADVVIAAVIGFFVGAKLYYVVLMRDWSLVFTRFGFVFWGGLIGGILAGWLVIRHKRVPFMQIVDVGAPGIAAGYAIGRTGCWAVGDDYGRPWNGALAVAFPEGTPPSTAGNLANDFGIPVAAGAGPDTVIAVHPTQLYETAMGLIMFWILWRLRDHKHAEGWLFGVYCVLAGVERFLVEFLRAKDDRVVGSLTVAQLIALAFVAVGVVWMYLRRAPGPGKPGIYGEAAASGMLLAR